MHIGILAFGFWVLMGVAAATIAGGKGRDGTTWFFIGFLAGPLGLLFALLVPPKMDE